MILNCDEYKAKCCQDCHNLEHVSLLGLNVVMVKRASECGQNILSRQLVSVKPGKSTSCIRQSLPKLCQALHASFRGCRDGG